MWVNVDRYHLPDKVKISAFIDYLPKGTKTEWNSEPLKILKKLKVLSRNWTYDFRKNISYDKILKFRTFRVVKKVKIMFLFKALRLFAQFSDSYLEIKADS